jgi:hypothetical protein
LLLGQIDQGRRADRDADHGGEGPFSRSQLNALEDLAEAALEEIFMAQRAVLRQ